MAEIIWFVFVGIALLGSIASVVRHYLNQARVKLDRIGLPLTFYNVFFLTAEEEKAAREASRRQAMADDLVLARELVMPELQREMQERVDSGVDPSRAAAIVLKSESMKRG